MNYRCWKRFFASWVKFVRRECCLGGANSTNTACLADGPWQNRTGIGFAGILRLVPPQTFSESMRYYQLTVLVILIPHQEGIAGGEVIAVPHLSCSSAARSS